MTCEMNGLQTVKFVFSPDVILCGWLGSKHQLTKKLLWLSNLVAFAVTMLRLEPWASSLCVQYYKFPSVSGRLFNVPCFLYCFCLLVWAFVRLFALLVV